MLIPNQASLWASWCRWMDRTASPWDGPNMVALWLRRGPMCGTLNKQKRCMYMCDHDHEHAANHIFKFSSWNRWTKWGGTLQRRLQIGSWPTGKILKRNMWIDLEHGLLQWIMHRWTIALARTAQKEFWRFGAILIYVYKLACICTCMW